MAENYVVTRSRTMEADPATVFAKIVDLREWSHWSPWDELDPDMDKTYSGNPGEVGSGYHWTGNRKVGEGRMTITDIDAPNRVAIDLEFIKPFKSQSVTEITVTPQGEGSEVTWTMTGRNTLMTRIMGIFKSMDAMVGPDFEKGLTSLDRVVTGA